MNDGLVVNQVDFSKAGTWNEIYSGDPEGIPWDIGRPSPELEAFTRTIKPCNALDIGCGTGTEAIYLAKKGFDVSALDISSKAIKLARKKARKARVNIEFKVGNALSLPFENNSFGFVNDRGLFHAIPEADRARFVGEVYRVLKQGGNYLMACFSDQEPSSEKGPYRFSKQAIRTIFSGAFEIKRIEPIIMHGRNIKQHKGYSCLMEKVK